MDQPPLVAWAAGLQATRILHATRAVCHRLKEKRELLFAAALLNRDCSGIGTPGPQSRRAAPDVIPRPLGPPAPARRRRRAGRAARVSRKCVWVLCVEHSDRTRQLGVVRVADCVHCTRPWRTAAMHERRRRRREPSSRRGWGCTPVA